LDGGSITREGTAQAPHWKRRRMKASWTTWKANKAFDKDIYL